MGCRSRVALWAVFAMVVVGGVLRVVVAGQDLLADELATYWVVSAHGLWGVVRTVSTTAEISPPLSFMLSWLTTRIGLSPELIRLPALIAGIASIPLVYAVGIRTVGRRAALLAAALTTLSPFMIFYSAEARGYGVAMALVLASTLALLVAIDDGRRRWWVVYGVFVCLAAYTHYTVVFVLAVQFGWVLWAYPRFRRALLISTAAAVVLYLPWLPSLKADIDSPTTKILDRLSPFTVDYVRVALEHWSLGYPYATPKSQLADLPGVPALVLLGVSVCLGVYGLFMMRARLGSRLAAGRGRAVLIMVLALATPVGAALQSAVGHHVFSVRSLAASWPYLALAVAGLITAGRPALRLTAATLAVVAFGLGAAGMLRADFQRPQFSELAQFVNERGKGVVVDGAAVTPGPLTNFDVEGSTPQVPVFRLTVPEQKKIPFAFGQRNPVPADVARRAAAAAGDGPITIMTISSASPLVAQFIAQFVDLLPKGYRLTHIKVVGGLFALEARVYERRPKP